MPLRQVSPRRPAGATPAQRIEATGMLAEVAAGFAS